MSHPESESQDFPNITGLSYTTNEIPDQNTTISTCITEVSSGPLPNPTFLEKYNQIIPDGANRIMIMSEKEQDFRLSDRKEARQMEKNKIAKQLKYMQRGQIMAFTIAFVVLGLATLFVFTGHESVAYVLFGASIVSLVGLFLGVSRKNDR